MDAIVGVWLTSLVGAAAFSAAGYVLGQRGVGIPFLQLMPRDEGRSPAPALPPLPTPLALPPSTASAPPSSRARTEQLMPPANLERLETTTPLALPPVAEMAIAIPAPSPSSPGYPSRHPPAGAGRYSKTPRAPDVVNGDDVEEDDDDRPTLVPDTLTHAAVVAAATATIPPLRAPSIKVSGSSRSLPPPMPQEDVEALKSELRAAGVRAESAAQRARAAEAVRSELEKQLENVRTELKQEHVARATAESRLEELGDRLVSASEEAAGLRHKVSVLDRQSKQLREALQGRVRALTTSEWHRRRDLEDAEEIRVKLRDVYDKLERSSLPPDPRADVSSSYPPHSSSPSSPSSSSSTPGMPAVRSGRPASFTSNDEDDALALVNSLRSEVSRLSSENQSLRARASVGNQTTKRVLPSHASAPDLDLEVYRELVERVSTIAGLRGAVIADELGSLLVGSGDLAEALAAFGAYIKDAGARTDQLLPLEGVEEIDIRDRTGMLFSTRVITHEPAELSLVLLGTADASMMAAKKITEEMLRFRDS